MSRLVVDASAGVKWFLPEAGTADALRLQKPAHAKCVPAASLAQPNRQGHGARTCSGHMGSVLGLSVGGRTTTDLAVGV
jgi:hypothetical protein